MEHGFPATGHARNLFHKYDCVLAQKKLSLRMLVIRVFHLLFCKVKFSPAVACISVVQILFLLFYWTGNELNF